VHVAERKDGLVRSRRSNARADLRELLVRGDLDSATGRAVVKLD